MNAARITTLFVSFLLIVGCASKPAQDKATAAKGAATAAQETKKTADEKAKEAKAAVEKKASETAGKIVCKHKKDERTLETVKTASGGCEVKYTKHGETTTTANAANGIQHCVQVVEKVKTNLTSAGFTCE